ncbi:peptidoglycan DD-metalloendopeptidase family protein [Verrucosispora sp. WMMC514]|uniref:M23 family metallopeptidase n=1 Tax=Verrucosispora sp. WMMC514 TaxID=3015156 RepID=UPI00248B6E1F|nr:peptidoglycan DD-metalloendopeptidase family protein [Verrucosispora sp. WMMC514]WBB93177.1 peptidoglycan DD-metalloendopeptidase family protein [Verrucosispora sp. WMMC514]
MVPLTIGRRRAYALLLLAPVLAASGCGVPDAPTGAGPTALVSPTAVSSPTAGLSPTAGVSPTAVATTGAPGATSAAPDRPDQPATPRAGLPHVFPVRAKKVSYHPTHSAYPGTDIFADCGEPVVAVTDGTIGEVSRRDRYRKSGPQGPYNGGLSVSVIGDDGVRYYGSHLTEIAEGVDAGVRVRAGQQLGTVGRTGNANNVCHLHFGISPPCLGEDGWWIRRGVVWPAPYLDSWRKGGNRAPAAEVTEWHRKHGCPRKPPTR